MQQYKIRNSSVELLRILAMLSIVSVHYWTCLQTQQCLEGQGFTSVVFDLLFQLMDYGVNIFVIITGYYMASATSVKLRKVFDLLWDIAFYGALLFCCSVLIGINCFSYSTLVKSIFPILGGLRWFVKAYVILYLLIPFINKTLLNITSKQHLVLIGLLLVLFSIWPFVLPFPPMDDYGFSFNHFIVLYIIISYFRLHVKDISVIRCWRIFILSSLIIWLLGHINVSISILATMKVMALAHNSPFKIAACISLFFIFLNHNWYNKYINYLATGAFAVYVIHGEFNIMQWIFETLFDGKLYQNGWIWLPHWLLTIILIYIICFILNLFVKQTIGRLFGKLFDKIKYLNLKIQIE